MDQEFGHLFYEGELHEKRKGMILFIVACLLYVSAIFITFNAPFIFLGTLCLIGAILSNRFLPNKVLFIFDRAIVISGLWYEEIYPRQLIERIEIKEVQARRKNDQTTYYQPYLVLKEQNKKIPLEKKFNEQTDQTFSRIIRSYVASEKVGA